MAEEKFYSALHWAKKAEKSADLAKQYGNDKINQTHITNCITEIPQDIKLELVDGVLTLKAGSKVYVPNGKNADGSNKFDVVVIASDLSWGDNVSDSQSIFCVASDGREIWVRNKANSVSGDNVTTKDGFSYNTTLNKINWYNLSSQIQDGDYSFPICIVSSDGSKLTSIDQVFNGFGYIGSTVFALPNVKGLIPDGRNEDGSLRNKEYGFDNVTTWMVVGNTNYQQSGIWVSPIDKTWYLANVYYETDGEPAVDGNHALWFNPRNNAVKTTTNGGPTWTTKQFVRIGQLSSTAKTITSVSFDKSFRAVDYSDSSWIAQQAMPSDKYIDLTLGASGTKYTAPANGWFVVRKRTAAANQGLFFGISNGVQFENYNPVSGAIIGLAVPAKRGDVLNTSYSASGATEMFRFIYAEGDK